MVSVLIAEKPGKQGRLQRRRSCWGEAIPGPGPCSIYTRRFFLVSEDELQKEDHLR